MMIKFNSPQTEGTFLRCLMHQYLSLEILQREMDKSTIPQWKILTQIVKFVTVIDRSSKKKFNKDMGDLNCTVNKLYMFQSPLCLSLPHCLNYCRIK